LFNILCNIFFLLYLVVSMISILFIALYILVALSLLILFNLEFKVDVFNLFKGTLIIAILLGSELKTLDKLL